MSIRSKLRPFVALAFPAMLLLSIIDRLTGHPIAKWEATFPDQRLVARVVVVSILSLAGLLIFVMTGKDAETKARPATRPKVTTAGREVWFEPWAGGGWNPVHWKGWVISAVPIVAIVIMAAQSPRLEKDAVLTAGAVFAVFASLAWFIWMAKRHCMPRG